MVGLVNPTGGARWLWIGFVLAIWSGSRASGVPGCPVASWPRLASYLQIRRVRVRPGFRMPGGLLASIGFVLANSLGSGGAGVPGFRRLLGPGLASYSQIGRAPVRSCFRGARWLLGPDWLRTCKSIGLGAVRGSGFPAASWPRIGFVLANWSGSGAFEFPRRPVASWPRLASSLQIDRLGGGRGARWLGGPGLASYLQVDRARGRPGFRVSGGFLAPIGFVLANCRSGDAPRAAGR